MNELFDPDHVLRPIEFDLEGEDIRGGRGYQAFLREPARADPAAAGDAFVSWDADLEGARKYYAPDWEWRTAQLFPGTDAVYRGKDGFARFWNTFREPWNSIHVELERIEDLGDRVLVLMMFHGKGKWSGVDVTREYANVITLRGGLVTYQVGYPDWRSALEAVGLSA
jgi:ketosteroid isomerase-like protein